MPPDRSADFSPEHWERVQALFEAILDASEDAATEPEAILAREHDPAIAAAARRLLRHHQSANREAFLEHTLTLIAGFTSEDDAPQYAPGATLDGRFTIERLLGRGGMGEVYLALDGRLNERVAIKTIRGKLLPDASIRRRFLAEIQTARRVTHRNVCRIFDLFEQEGDPFFSMEYVEGDPLKEWLADAQPQARARRRVALELAEGLLAAHRNGVLHCDFKPANVLVSFSGGQVRAVITDFGLARAFSGGDGPNLHSLQAGTLDYMAPELHDGGPPSVRSDIYAFGKVLGELLPRSRLVQVCVAPRAEDRPASLDSVVRSLSGTLSRRAWMMAAAATPFAGVAAYREFTRPALPLLSRQRLAFNGFRPEGGGAPQLLRDLLITALRQSLMVTIVPDDRVRYILSRMNIPPKLPVARNNLLAAAIQDGIGLVVEGTLSEAGTGLHFLLQIFRAGENKPALEIYQQASDSRQIIGLAERVALQVRREFGESAAQAGYTPVDRLTSASPEAAEFYFRGVRLYEKAEAEASIDWFDQAVRIDPQFALAHLSRGIALAARYQWADCISSYERAFSLRSRVSERERLWIEASYFNIAADFVSSLAVSRRLGALYPGEAVFQRNVAFAYAATGRPVDALPFSRRALELEPTGVSNCSELIVNHAEANLCDEALDLYREFRAKPDSSTLFEWGHGLALMGKGEMEQAWQAFSAMGADAKRDRWARLLRCAPRILQGRFDDAATELGADLAWDIASHEQGHLLARRASLGNLELLRDQPAAARAQAVELAHLEASPLFLESVREGAMLALETEDIALAREALARLREIEARWPSTHSHGVRLHIEGVLVGGAPGGDLLNQAAGLWPDPPTLFARALWRAGQGQLSAALADCESLDAMRGRILKRHFPGLLILGWLGKARCLSRMARFPEALRVYSQIKQYWLPDSVKHYATQLAVREELDRTQNLIKGEKHG